MYFPYVREVGNIHSYSYLGSNVISIEKRFASPSTPAKSSEPWIRSKVGFAINRDEGDNFHFCIRLPVFQEAGYFDIKSFDLNRFISLLSNEKKSKWPLYQNGVIPNDLMPNGFLTNDPEQLVFI